MKILLDKKLVLTSGEVEIKTLDNNVKHLDDVAIYLVNDGDKIFNHSVYPSGLVVQSHQYADKIITYSNWEFEKRSDNLYVMVPPLK